MKLIYKFDLELNLFELAQIINNVEYELDIDIFYEALRTIKAVENAIAFIEK